MFSSSMLYIELCTPPWRMLSHLFLMFGENMGAASGVCSMLIDTTGNQYELFGGKSY
jgi:hypothetical protein